MTGMLASIVFFINISLQSMVDSLTAFAIEVMVPLISKTNEASLS